MVKIPFTIYFIHFWKINWPNTTGNNVGMIFMILRTGRTPIYVTLSDRLNFSLIAWPSLLKRCTVWHFIQALLAHDAMTSHQRQGGFVYTSYARWGQNSDKIFCSLKLGLALHGKPRTPSLLGDDDGSHQNVQLHMYQLIYFTSITQRAQPNV